MSTKYLVCTLLGGLALAQVPTASAASLTNSAIQLPFSRPQQLVDIGGRRLNLYCSGSGSPTVIFDSPSTDGGWSWYAVQPEVAKHSRACVYDRAGLGFSDPSPLPGTSSNAVNDLHTLLNKAGIAPPYVLVGNSYGGANVQLYTWRYPAEVKGLVLAEPHHEDDKTRLNLASQGKIKQFQDMMDEMGKNCLSQAEQGFAPNSEAWANCTGGIQAGYSRELAAAHLAVEISPVYWRAAFSENSNGDLNDADLRPARRGFGDIPLIVLTRSISPYAQPGKPQSALNKTVENENRAIHQSVAALSTRGSERVIPGAGHVIQMDKPEAVVKAVAEVLEQAK